VTDEIGPIFHLTYFGTYGCAHRADWRCEEANQTGLARLE